jgi:hypothetical protein
MDDKATKAAGSEDEKAAAKAAEEKEAKKREEAKKRKEEEDEKEAKKGGSFAVAKAAHEAMGDCLDGKCDHKGVAKCAEAMKAAHDKMSKHFDASPAEGEAAKKEESEKAAGNSQLTAIDERINKLTELVEKSITGDNGRAKPHVSGYATISKTVDQGGGDQADVVTKMASLDKKDPEYANKLYALQREGELEKM